MVLVVAILVVAALLAGFLFVTTLEYRHGTRVLEKKREAFDRGVQKVIEAVADERVHERFFEDVRGVFEHLLHDSVHKVLIGVRLIERALTSMTRKIRGRQAAKQGEAVSTAPTQLE